MKRSIAKIGKFCVVTDPQGKVTITDECSKAKIEISKETFDKMVENVKESSDGK